MEVRRTADQYPPSVGLALADWLDAESDVYYAVGGYGNDDKVTASAFALADLILGGAS